MPSHVQQDLEIRPRPARASARDKAQNYAKSPEGKRQFEGLRRRFAKKR